jgi:hypothetical protein
VSSEGGAEGAALLPFSDLFYGLRRAGLKVGPSDWLGLMEALSRGVVRPSLTDFYHVSRALLVKDESQFDRFDQVFAAVFREGDMPSATIEHVLDWLHGAIEREFSEEDLAALEALSLDQLRERFEERLREQTERHDGGNRWVGTGGTSPFGHGGKNPAGVRVGGSGGGRSAVQVATARHFRSYRHDRVLDDRSLAIALKRLRRLTKRNEELELDVDASIDATCQNAGDLTLEFSPPRKNEARVVLLMDVGGSMDPYADLVERLFSAAHGLQHWKSFEAYAFHNCVYESLEPAKPHGDAIDTAELILGRPRDAFLIVVGDASMAPSELVDVFGANFYYHRNRTPGLVWLHRLRRHFERCVWLNPLPEKWWGGWTTRVIGEVFPMFPLTVDGIDRAVDELIRRAPAPVMDLEQIFPDLRQVHGGHEEIDR